MDALLAEHERLSKSGTFTKTLDDIQKTIDLLVKARETIAASEEPLAPLIVRCSKGKQQPADFHSGAQIQRLRH